MSFAPRVFCRVCYVATARTTLFLMPCHRENYFYCWYDIIFLFVFAKVLQHTRYKASAHTAVEEATQLVLSGSSDWEGGRVMRGQKATTSNDQDGGESSSLSTAKVRRALLRLSRQCRLNRHLVKTPQPRAATQRALLSLIAMLNCLTIDKSLGSFGDSV